MADPRETAAEPRTTLRDRVEGLVFTRASVEQTYGGDPWMHGRFEVVLLRRFVVGATFSKAVSR